MNSITPLFIDATIEVEEDTRASTLWVRVWRRLDSLLPLRLYYRVPRGRRSVEAQLSRRVEFARDEWSQTSLPVENVQRVLKVLQRELNLPSHFLVSEDPLFLVLTGDYDDLPVESVRMGLREALGVNISREDLQQMYEVGNCTVGAFVAFVLELQNAFTAE